MRAIRTPCLSSLLLLSSRRRLPLPTSFSRKWTSTLREVNGSRLVGNSFKASPSADDLAQQPILSADERVRDHCHCHLCIDPSSKQRLFRSSDIPDNIKASYHVSQAEDEIEIRWENDIPGYPADHVTRLPFPHIAVPELKEELFEEAVLSWLRDNRIYWDRDTITKENKWIEYDKYMADDEALYRGLEHLVRYGLIFLKGVPDDEKAVERIGERIGLLKDTFYGRTWDVKSKPEAKNIAYTSQFLGLHQDLLYVSNPPQLQILHSLRARSPGGASLFSDAFNAANILYNTSSSQFDELRYNLVPYHYRNDGQSYRATRPTIKVRKGNFRKQVKQVGQLPIEAINYSPPFQAPWTHWKTGLVELFPAWKKALQTFTQLVEDEKHMFEHRLEEGECVIFDNRRVLHARREFDPSAGERWLKGGYVDTDVFQSRLKVLAGRFEVMHDDSVYWEEREPEPEPEGQQKPTEKGILDDAGQPVDKRILDNTRRPVDKGILDDTGSIVI